MKLKDRDTLQKTDAAKAFFPVMSNDTNKAKPRKISLPRLPEIQQRVNPFTIESKIIELVKYDAPNFARTDAANDLSIKEGATLHNFDDGYQYIEFEFLRGSVPVFEKVSAETFRASSNTQRIGITRYTRSGRSHPSYIMLSIWRENATAFRISYTSQYSYNRVITPLVQNNTNGFLRAIYGHRRTLKRKG